MEKITVFTPAYNRAYSINLCYESLCRQTCKDFIWMVIDDGSTDNTAQLIKEWQKLDNGFKIEYIYKKNGGMHSAHNTAYDNIKTELNVCIDSDDYMTDNAIEEILKCWEDNKSEKYAGILALDIFTNNEIIGVELRRDKTDITLSGFYANGGRGDKKLIYRTDIINKYPRYPEFEGERYVGLSYIYHLIDQDYTLVILNEPVCVVEYRTDGSGYNMFRQYLNNPKGFAFYRKETMKLTEGFASNFKCAVHYVSSCIIGKERHFIKQSPKKGITVLAVPFGAALTVYIRTMVKLKKM